MTRNDLGVDCISKQAVLDGFEKYSKGSFGYGCVWDYVKNLPSVTPQEPRKGYWIDKGSLSCRCSECGCKNNKETSFCPSCGADMRGNTKRKGNPIEGNNESYNCENWIP